MLTEQALYKKRVQKQKAREARRRPLGYTKELGKRYGAYADNVHKYRVQEMRRIATMPKQQQGMLTRIKNFFRRAVSW